MQPFFRKRPKAAKCNLYYMGNVPQYIENVKENFMEDKKKTLRKKLKIRKNLLMNTNLN